MASLCERRSRRRWSTPTAGTFVANKANEGQTGIVTAAANECLVRE